MNTLNNRLQSADIYRGFVMFLMMAETLRFSQVAKNIPDSSFWAYLSFHQSHVSWIGCSLHDLIQPSFSFLVGVVLPYSIASRANLEASFSKNFLHIIKRSFILIGLGVFLRSQYSTQTYFTFEDTLSQIGLGYPFLYFLGLKTKKTQIISFFVVIIIYWLVFATFPLPGVNFNYSNSGVTNDWEHNLKGFAAHWNKNTNFAWAFDCWFLNLFPVETPFLFNEGGYSTLSFIPTLATMILGLLAGNVLKSSISGNNKVKTFLIIGVSCFLISFILKTTGICPNIKRIWTPTWVLYSGGWCFLILAFFYWIIDLKQKGNWFYFFKVIGVNSIAAYIIADAFGIYINNTIKIHFGEEFSRFLGVQYQPIINGIVLLLIYWSILRWMFLKKIFIKI